MDSSTYKAPNAVGKKDAGTVEDVSRDLNAIKAALADIEDAEAICSRLPGATYSVIKHLLQNHLLSAKVHLMQMNLLTLDQGNIVNDTGTIASDSTTRVKQSAYSLRAIILRQTMMKGVNLPPPKRLWPSHRHPCLHRLLQPSS